MVLACYLRNIIGSLLAAAWTGVCSLAILFCIFFVKKRPVEDMITKNWGQVCLQCLGVTAKLEGAENIPDRGVLFVFNHTSNVDILLMHAYLPKSFRFGAKIELFSIPIFGRAIRAAGALPIARQNRNEVFRVYDQARVRVEKGESFALAPEGTRQGRREIGSFKSGPFIFAINAGAPIVPVVICGGYEIYPKSNWFVNWGKWTSAARIKVLPPVEVTNFDIKTRPELQEKVRNMMVAEFNKLSEEMGLSTKESSFSANQPTPG